MSTCLRIEIAWAADPDRAPAILACLYGDGSVLENGVVRTDEAALAHLCRIAAGLASPLIGEPEILGQFRHAVAVWRASSPSSWPLGRALEAAIGIARSTRRLVGDAPRGSLAALAAKAAAPHRRVAILGAGAMARAAAADLHGLALAIFSRQPTLVGPHATHPWQAAVDVLATYPVVIAAIPGDGPPSRHEALRSALARRSEPLLLIDLGMPPAFVRTELAPSVRYVGVDELASSVRSQPPAQAEEWVAKGAASAWARLSAREGASAVIAAILAQAEIAVGEEVQRFAKRLPQAEDPERVLRQLAHTVARRVLHPPISFVGSEGGGEALDVLSKAFGINHD